MWQLSSGILLGWSLGANDAANAFGTAVASNVVKWRTAAILTAIFVVVGAMLEGGRGLHTLGNLADSDLQQAFITMASAAISVVIMTKFKLPVSTSQAVVGAIIATGLLGTGVRWEMLTRIVACWVGTPVGAAIISFILYMILSRFLSKITKVTSMIDVSDGLLQDLGHIVKSSKVGCIINEEKLPISRDTLILARKNISLARKHALSDGEDFELLFTVPKKHTQSMLKRWKKTMKTRLTSIGVITSGNKVLIRKNNSRKLVPIKLKGFIHFKDHY